MILSLMIIEKEVFGLEERFVEKTKMVDDLISQQVKDKIRKPLVFHFQKVNRKIHQADQANQQHQDRV